MWVIFKTGLHFDAEEKGKQHHDKTIAAINKVALYNLSQKVASGYFPNAREQAMLDRERKLEKLEQKQMATQLDWQLHRTGRPEA